MIQTTTTMKRAICRDANFQRVLKKEFVMKKLLMIAVLAVGFTVVGSTSNAQAGWGLSVGVGNPYNYGYGSYGSYNYGPSYYGTGYYGGGFNNYRNYGWNNGYGSNWNRGWGYNNFNRGYGYGGGYGCNHGYRW